MPVHVWSVPLSKKLNINQRPWTLIKTLSHIHEHCKYHHWLTKRHMSGGAQEEVDDDWEEGNVQTIHRRKCWQLTVGHTCCTGNEQSCTSGEWTVQDLTFSNHSFVQWEQQPKTKTWNQGVCLKMFPWFYYSEVCYQFSLWPPQVTRPES